MEYGRCPCGGTYEHRHVEVRMTVADGRLVTLSDVPQGACRLCGSRVYKVHILDSIETLWHSRQAAGT